MNTTVLNSSQLGGHSLTLFLEAGHHPLGLSVLGQVPLRMKYVFWEYYEKQKGLAQSKDLQDKQ
jgi:hypothetical protein